MTSPGSLKVHAHSRQKVWSAPCSWTSAGALARATGLDQNCVFVHVLIVMPSLVLDAVRIRFDGPRTSIRYGSWILDLGSRISSLRSWISDVGPISDLASLIWIPGRARCQVPSEFCRGKTIVNSDLPHTQVSFPEDLSVQHRT